MIHETINEEDKIDESSLMKRTVSKNLFIRVVSTVIDFAFGALTAILIALLTSTVIFLPIAKASGAYSEEESIRVSTTIENEEGKSFLFYPNPNYDSSDGSSKYLALNDKTFAEMFNTYDKYQERIYKYYTEYLNKLPEDGGAQFIDQSYLDNNTSKHLYSTYWYNVFILGQDDVLNYYTDTLSTRDEFISTRGKQLFVYDGTDYETKMAIPNPSYQSDEQTIDQAIMDYYSKSYSSKDAISKTYTYLNKKGKETKATVSYSPNIYERSLSHWIYESYDLSNDLSIYQLNARWYELIEIVNRWQVTYPAMAGIVVAWLIIYFLIPLIAKNGRTIGKILFKQAVVNKLNYSITPGQLFLRALAPLLIVIVTYVIGLFTSPIVFYASLGVITLASFALMIFTKKHQALHDLLALTMVIDSEKSVWFKNKNEEDAYQEKLDKAVPLEAKEEEEQVK